MRNELTLARLKSLLSYDLETGLFTRRVSQGRGKAGAVAGSADHHGHILITIDGVRYAAHQLAIFYVTSKWPVAGVDHRNGHPAENWYLNLREADQFINMQNLRGPTARNKHSGLLGVRRSGSRLNPWSAVITARGQFTHLGVFATPEQAHAAYIAAKRQLHEGNTL